MLFHMLKKDLLKRKGINLILFMFITLATVFLASSVNNIFATTSAVEYYMDYANIADIEVVLTSDLEKDEIKVWLDKEKKPGKVTSYEQEVMLKVQDKAITLMDGSAFDGKGNSLFLSKSISEYNKVFDADGKSLLLNEGEIALSPSSLQRNHLKVGDQVYVQMNGIKKTFTIKNSTKDAAYGSDMVGMIRFIVSDQDYELFSSNADVLVLNAISTNDVNYIQQELSNESFTSILNYVKKDMYTLIYSFDMILAALLIVIGICLILIALLVLRFTLVFTLEEEYQEIGILKAVGLRNWAIKKLYLLKYFVLVCSGALCGLLLSYPISDFMVASISENMIMQESEDNFIVNIICAFAIVLLVLLFCYFCTNKLNKVSAIHAIRNGSSGERYQNHRSLSLANRKGMKVALYLAINDIFSNMKRYAVLICTFCISFILITIPLNTTNTMKSEEMSSRFAVKRGISVLLNEIEQPSEGSYTNVHQLDDGMKRIKQELRTAGYEAELTAVQLYFFKYSAHGEKNYNNIMTLQLRGDYTDYLEYSEGSSPILENEVAVSKPLLKENNWKIGDRIDIQLAGGTKELIISGSYSDYMQIGENIRLNPVLNLEQEVMFEYQGIQVDFKEDKSQSEWVALMREQFPAYSWKSTSEYINDNIGGIQAMVDQILLPMTSMLCGVIMLITLLMERLFITREKAEIAMLKSIGFNRRAITSWQMLRMGCVVIASMVISIPLSLISNQFLLKPVFAIMGADITIQVDSLSAYLVYPGILLIGILVATFIATGYIRRIHIRDMNNVE